MEILLSLSFIDDAREETRTQHGGGVGAMEQFLVALKTMPSGSWFHRYRSDELPLRNGVKDCHRLILNNKTRSRKRISIAVDYGRKVEKWQNTK